MAYSSVVISGLPGAGKGVLARKLAEKYGWKLFSIGDIWRERWKEFYPGNEISFEDYWKNASSKEQKSINDEARKIIGAGDAIGDFRFAICCKDLPSLFVFIRSDLNTRAERALEIEKYPGKSLKEIKNILKERELDELGWGRELFGQEYDFRDEEHYGLILDSGKLELEDEIELIDKELR
jgi:cytidylate kinase